ncbi:MAG TPA: flagellar basal body-associated FliL family protein [Tepidisphaeraceae bacterium]|jgi:flagellar basal body-associated protein FliL|nr:flagellar basal body-associated FliL family protein [Tepidisphaeraceae bacterium]HEV8604138.1 flagellar basal body-associated FliL family protein [Tepidisphaeraceae bacterium]
MAKEKKEAEDKNPAPAKPPEEKKAAGGGMGGLLKSTPALLGVVMVIEAGVLFAGFKIFNGPPHSAHAAEAGGEEEGGEHGDPHGGPIKGEKKKVVELNVLEFKAPNKQSGRLFLYDVSVYVTVKTEFKERVEMAFKDREATIKDRARTIISQSDPEKLGGGTEPGLETLRRQMKHQLDEIIGEGMIEEVLIPRCIPYRQDF